MRTIVATLGSALVVCAAAITAPCVATAQTSSPAQAKVGTIITVTYNFVAQKNEIWSLNPTTGTSARLLQFSFPSGSFSPSNSFTDPTSGKVYLSDSQAGGYVVYDLSTNSTTFIKTSVPGGYTSSPILPGGTNSIVSTATDSKGNPATVLGTSTVVSSSGSSLIGSSADGAIHIGANSLVTVESNGKQLLYATDANGKAIPINITNGSDLQVNGVSIAGSLDRLNRSNTSLTNGVSMAMAMVGGNLPDGKRFALSMNQGFFGGTTATAISGSLRAHDNVVISGALSYGYRSSEVGSRVGVQFAW